MKIKRMVSVYDYYNQNSGFNPLFDLAQKTKLIDFLGQFFKNDPDQHNPDCQPAAVVYFNRFVPALQNLSNTEAACGSIAASGIVFKARRSRVYGQAAPVVADRVWRTTIRFDFHA